MTIVRELITVLGYDVDKSGVKGAADAFASLKAKAIAVKAAWDLAVGTLRTVVVETADAGDAAAKAGKRLGISAEEVQELGFAAERSGVPIQALQNGIRSLQRRAAEAGEGNKAFAEGFKRLGISAKQAALTPTVDLLEQVATALQGVQDEGERTAIAMRVAGDGGAQLLPLFLEGAKGIQALRSEARDLGFVMDNEAAAASEVMADSFLNLERATEGVIRRVGVQLFPIFRRITDSTTRWLVENRRLIDQGIKVLVGILERSLDLLSEFYRLIVENRRAVALFAAVLASAALPGLFALTKAFLALFIAQLKAVAIPALMTAGFIALAAVIALVIEDVYAFVTGSESLIGNLIKVFVEAPIDPNEHWILTVLRDIIAGVQWAVESVDDFFKIWTAQAVKTGSVWGGVVETLSMAWEGLVKVIEDAIDAVNIFGDDDEENRKNRDQPQRTGRIPRRILDRSRQIEAGQAPGSPQELVDRRLALLGPQSPGQAPVPSVPVIQPTQTGGASQTVVQGSQAQISISLPPGTDPSEVGESASRALRDVLEEDRREAARALGASGRVVR